MDIAVSEDLYGDPTSKMMLEKEVSLRADFGFGAISAVGPWTHRR